MLAARLTQDERQFVTALCAELDGVPYVDKARVIGEALEAMRQESRLTDDRSTAVVPTAETPPARLAEAA